MVRTASSDFFLFLFILLVFIPVSAAGDNAPVLPERPIETAQPSPPYTIELFIPMQRMIHSDQINDLVSGASGETIIGTSFGLSTYNGSWSTRHQIIGNVSEGLLDDYITALERDGDGNLWIGYSGGVQIYNGNTYRTIRDQQILKETRIKALQRWNNDMWIATGHSGIHRYRNGIWTWYQPLTRKGPGFYEIRSMGLDPVHDTIVITTEVEGLWILQVPDDQATFTEIASRYSTYGFLEQVRNDPEPGGGVYLFNKTMVIHYDPARGFIPTLTRAGLAPGDISINDITVAPDGRLFIATDDGMYIWEDGQVTGHVGRFEGLGTSPVVRTVTIDAKSRVWFSSEGYVGYYADQTASVIPIEMVTPVLTTITSTPSPVHKPEPAPVPAQPAVTKDQPFFPDTSFFVFLNPIIDPIVKALRAIGLPG